MSGLIKRKLKKSRGLALTLIFLLMCGCSTTRPPYVLEPKVLPPVQFTSQHSPTVRVRPASSEEAKIITQFPGKKEPNLLSWTDMVLGWSVGSITSCGLLPMFGVLVYQNRNEPGIKRAFEEFPSRLQEAIEQRFSVPSSGESSDLLEVVYFAGLSDFWYPLVCGKASEQKQNINCFVIHAQITLQSKGQEVYRDIIRIDPQAYNADVSKPTPYATPFGILNYANEIIPKMIETRLPGLPWKAKNLRENNKLTDEPLKRDHTE